MVYSYDRSTWISQGTLIQERVINQDLIQTAEMGRGVVAADLNGDGFLDLVRTHVGGYDSRDSDAKNLAAMIDGRAQVIPPPDYNYPTLTEYEPGRTELLLNHYREGAWIKVRLVDDTPGSLNRDAIGARVVINRALLRVKRAGIGSFLSNVSDDLHFGLGSARATAIEVTWPDRARSVTRHTLDSLARGRLVVAKQAGVAAWHPTEEAR